MERTDESLTWCGMDRSATEIEELQHRFRWTAFRRRRFSYRVACLIGLAPVVTLLSIMAGAWIMSPALVALVLVVATTYVQPKLSCPACHEDMECCGDYCPVCGNEGLPHCTRHQSPYCVCCETLLKPYQREWRDYKIHFCTHCGLPLDDEGV